MSPSTHLLLLAGLLACASELWPRGARGHLPEARRLARLAGLPQHPEHREFVPDQATLRHLLVEVERPLRALPYGDSLAWTATLLEVELLCAQGVS